MHRIILWVICIVIPLVTAGGSWTGPALWLPDLPLCGKPATISPLPLSACVWVRAGDNSGAGVLIDGRKRWVITARHVVGDSKRIEVVFPVGSTLDNHGDRQFYLERRRTLQHSRHWVSAHVARMSDDLDIALVELEHLPVSWTSARWTNQPVAPGETLILIGHRADLPTLWNRSTGCVRAQGYVHEGYFVGGRKVATAAHLLLVQMPIEEGDSGGPVFNHHGELVGIGVAVRRVAAPAALVVSAEDIGRFLRSDGLAPPQSPTASLRPPVDRLASATVWVRPASATRSFAGFLVDSHHVVTVAAAGTRPGDAVGVVAPYLVGNKCRQERHFYQDNLDLHQRGLWRWATVVASDPQRQITLLRLSAPFAHLQPLTLAFQSPRVGDTIHAMNHPAGVEFAWVYAQGIIRQQGRVPLLEGSSALRLLIGQLPSHASCPGGPVINARAELVGVWLEREGPAQAAYILSVEEVRHFLNIAGIDGCGPQSWEAMRAWLARRYNHVAQAVARGLVTRATEQLRRGQKEAAWEDLTLALRWDATCLPARRLRLQLLVGEALEAEWNAVIEHGPFDSHLLLQRSLRAMERRDWRLARGDLQRLLAIRPEIAEAYQLLIRVLLESGEHELAANAVRDSLRADPRQRPAVARILRQHAQELLRKYPLQPHVARDWLRLALQRSGHRPWQEGVQQVAALAEPRQQIEYLVRLLDQEQP